SASPPSSPAARSPNPSAEGHDARNGPRRLDGASQDARSSTRDPPRRTPHRQAAVLSAEHEPPAVRSPSRGGHDVDRTERDDPPSADRPAVVAESRDIDVIGAHRVDPPRALDPPRAQPDADPVATRRA